MSKPLRNKKILITREQNQAKVFAEKVLQHGGEPVEVPLLKITCKDRLEDKHVFQKISMFKWIFFTSANGVHCFYKALNKQNISPDVLQHMKVAVVGHKTEKALKSHGFSADFIPTVYDAEHMAREFLLHFVVDGPLLLVRGSRSRPVLPEVFSKIGLDFKSIVVYSSSVNYKMADRLNEVLQEKCYDFITFTSPSTVEAFVEMAKLKQDNMCVCIGTTTEKRARELGFTTILTPDEFTIDGMIARVSDYIATKG